LAGVALLLATIVWIVVVNYAYAQIQASPKKPISPRAVLGLGPYDCYIRALEVHPTANESEWQWTYYVKSELVFNETFVGEYCGELAEPLHPYVKDAIENQYYFIRFAKEEWEEWNSIPITDGVYKYNGTYYLFEKAQLDNMFIDLFWTPEELWAIRHSQSIGPAVGASGVSLLGCWMSLGVYELKRTMKRPTEVRK
jgi:hypothetical protein